MPALSERTAARRTAFGLALLAGAIVVAISLPCWGGPGIHPGSVAYVLIGGLLGPLVVAIILLSPSWRPPARAAWAAIAAGLILYDAAGVWLGLQVHYDPESVPVPYWTDALFTAAYACWLTAVVIAGRHRARRLPGGAIVDGLLIALGVLTLAAATVLNERVTAGDVSVARAATALAYPLWDLTLFGTLAVVVLTRSRALDRRWVLLGLATVLFAGADIAYLHYASTGNFSPRAWYHPLYFAAFLVLAAAAWTPARPGALSLERSRWSQFAPGVVAVVAGVVLVWDHYSRRSAAAVVLAAAALGFVLARSLFTYQELERVADARRLALTDDLTGLPNRRRFRRELRAAAAAAERTGRGFAVAILDVDRFQELNDTLGHDLGDRMLGEVGLRLRARLPSSDLLARLGGDEFAVLPAPSDEPEQSGWETGRRIADALSGPVELGGVSLHVSASVGVALCPDHGADAESLLKRADVAMYQAKSSGSNCQIYSAERDQFSLQRLALGADLQLAPARGELQLLYQPIADARSGRFVRAEALLRWQHPTRGLLEPREFLAIAEHTGSMRAVTATVLRLAIGQCDAWRRAGHPLGVAVNLAASDLLDTAMLDNVRAILADSALEPRMLQLEITEHGLLDDPRHAVEVLAQLRELGVGVSVDDFGTGYASLSYLRGLPVDELKIDRSFVAGVAEDPDDAAIVRSTILLGHELGLTVVAEGVERPEVLHLVTEWGADVVQGFLIGRPSPGEAIPELAARSREENVAVRRLAASQTVPRRRR